MEDLLKAFNDKEALMVTTAKVEGLKDLMEDLADVVKETIEYVTKVEKNADAIRNDLQKQIDELKDLKNPINKWRD